MLKKNNESLADAEKFKLELLKAQHSQSHTVRLLQSIW